MYEKGNEISWKQYQRRGDPSDRGTIINEKGGRVSALASVTLAQ